MDLLASIYQGNIKKMVYHLLVTICDKKMIHQRASLQQPSEKAISPYILPNTRPRSNNTRSKFKEALLMQSTCDCNVTSKNVMSCHTATSVCRWRVNVELELETSKVHKSSMKCKLRSVTEQLH